MRQRVRLVPLPKVPMLITESADEFGALDDGVCEEIKPRGIIENIFARDITHNQWEIERLRRCKAAIINAAFRDALEQVIAQLLRQPGESDEVEIEAQELAQTWFRDKKARELVSELLTRFQLDESAIEAEAVRSCCSDLESLDRMIASLESRRDDAVRLVAGYRASVARQLRESADETTANVRRLEDASKKRSTAA